MPQLNHIKPYFQLFEDTDLDTLNEVLDVDLRSYVVITKLLLDDMIARDASLIVVSSVAGKVGVPYAAIYAGSKHALHGLYDALRTEIGLTHPDSSMSITTCVIGNVNTESAVEKTKGKLRHSNRVSPHEVAAAIIKVCNSVTGLVVDVEKRVEGSMGVNVDECVLRHETERVWECTTLTRTHTRTHAHTHTLSLSLSLLCGLLHWIVSLSQGGVLRRREIAYPLEAGLATYLQFFAPRLMESLIVSAVNRPEPRPKGQSQAQQEKKQRP